MRTEWTPEQVSATEPDYSAEGMNEGALRLVEYGYNEPTRCLHFRAHFYRGEGAGVACRIIDAYNDFSGEKVARALESLEGLDYVDVGREYSPVLYISRLYVEDDQGRWVPPNVADIAAAMRDACADEVDVVKPGVVRAWWD